jgi:murein DD-endopeptidase MepM/ murein hydrolase activator NlpD
VDKKELSNQSKKANRAKLNPKKILLISTVAICCSFLLNFYIQDNRNNAASIHDAQVKLGAFEVIEPTTKYGFVLDTFNVEEQIIQENEFISDILTRYKVDYMDIEKMVTEYKDVFDVRTLRAGKPYTILSTDTSQMANYFIYEPSVYSFIVFDFNNKNVYKVEHPIETRVETASGIIETSLWNAMVDNELSYELTAKMEDALAWSVDFYYIQKDDKFKLIYDRKYIDGEPVGVGDIKAAYFKNYDNEYYAIHFENEKHNGFYDLEARPMKKAFLKSPVKYSRISSGFNMRRFHPILKRTKAHLGTDYAAPRGTPILAVADGVVVKRGRTRGNGNYIKIKHDNVYQTQYLHMNGFATGVNTGVHVKQGQTIGYVGSTGLATGPHVCFRFWKNGRQVNHLRENLPPPEAMPSEDIPKFNLVRDEFKVELDKIQYKTFKEVVNQEVVSDTTINTNP